MHFIDGERRARHQFIEKSLDVTAEVLTHPYMAHFLGRAATGNAIGTLRDLYIPNVRHGEVKLRRNLDNEAVPVITVLPGETAQVEKRIILPTPEQELNIDRYFKTRIQEDYERGAFIRTALQLIKQGATPLVIEPRPSALARVSGIGAYVRMSHPSLGSNPARYFKGRRVMSLAYTPDAPRMSPAVIIHELRHIDQAVMQPVDRFDTEDQIRDARYRQELEAYHTEMYAETALYSMGYTPEDGETTTFTPIENGFKSVSVLIDTLRTDTNHSRSDKFYPNGTLRNKLDEIGIDL